MESYSKEYVKTVFKKLGWLVAGCLAMGLMFSWKVAVAYFLIFNTLALLRE